MTNQEIEKAFEGRWRIKGRGLTEGANTIDAFFLNDRGARFVDYLKELCRDFFEAGILIGQGFVTGELIRADGTPTGIEVTVMHDPILDTDDNGFSEWWDMYDKKVDRKKCIKKWEKLTYNEKQLCIAATPAYIASTPDPQFRKNPLTYLNGECWNDEIIIKNNGEPTKQDPRDKLTSILVG